MQPLFHSGDTLLFQGDSITDANRDYHDPQHLGFGYASLAASWFQALYPEVEICFLNRGISGNRVTDLEKRWQEDCLELRPTWLSILIGVNDIWRHLESTEPPPLQVYETTYHSLLERTKAALPETRLILCEPFLLPVSAKHEEEIWRKELDREILVVRKLARAYGALYVPFDGLFAQAAARREPTFWAPDAVHPSPAGHALMAQAWLRAVQAI